MLGPISSDALLTSLAQSDILPIVRGGANRSIELGTLQPFALCYVSMGALTYDGSANFPQFTLDASGAVLYFGTSAERQQSVNIGTGISFDSATGVFQLAAGHYIVMSHVAGGQLVGNAASTWVSLLNLNGSTVAGSLHSDVKASAAVGTAPFISTFQVDGFDYLPVTVDDSVLQLRMTAAPGPGDTTAITTDYKLLILRLPW